MRLDTWSARSSARSLLESGLLILWVGVCVAGFLALARLTISGALDGLDDAALDWATGHRTPLRSAFAGGISFLGTRLALTVASALIVVALWRRGRRSGALEVAASCVAAGFLTPALKLLLARPRPPITTQLLPVSGFSFPSGHASGIAALLTVTALLSFAAARTRGRRLALVLVHVVLGLAVGASRVYLGAHYPSDVIAGLALGIACGLGAHSVVSRRA